jgi:hypothetical protein
MPDISFSEAQVNSKNDAADPHGGPGSKAGTSVVNGGSQFPDTTTNANSKSGGGTRTPRHLAALAFAKAGIPVFPCLPNAKQPATSAGFKDATTDPVTINWWYAKADYNIGIPPDEAGWCVIDLDGPEGLASWEALCEAHGGPIETYTVATPHGRHLYFAGSLPCSAKRLGPGIDTRGGDARGATGYVIGPTSIVGGKTYAVIDNGADIAPLPGWLPPLLERSTVALAAPERELNAGRDISRARSYLRSVYEQQGPWGETDPPTNTFAIAAQVKDLGCSEAMTVDLLMEHLPENEQPWIERTVRNAFTYGQNDPGSKGIGPIPQVWHDLAKQVAEAKAKVDTGRYKIRWATEFEDKPPIEFWDDDKTLVKSAMGAVGIIYGEYSTHKTNTALSMIFKAAAERGAKVIYTAGEGLIGIETARFPAHRARYGWSREDTVGKIGVIEAVPPFASDNEVQAYIDAMKADMEPDIVVIDTLATAIAGQDENSSIVSGYLTANGPVGGIRDAFKCLVLIVAHSGKDPSRGIRGHSGFGGNPDVILEVTSDDSGAIQVHAEKIKDGAQNFDVHWKVEPTGVPVPVRIGKAEYEALIGSRQGAVDKDPFLFRQQELIDQRRGTFDSGYPEPYFADMLIPPLKEGATAEEEANRRTAVEREYNSLKCSHNKPRYHGVLCDQRVPVGGTKMQWRWFIVAGLPAAEPEISY